MNNIKSLLIIGLIAWFLILGSLGKQNESDTLLGNVNTSLIPREALFGNPDKILTRISPNGENISFLAPSNGVLNIWVGPAQNPEKAKPVTNESYRGISSYGWAYIFRQAPT